MVWDAVYKYSKHVRKNENYILVQWMKQKDEIKWGMGGDVEFKYDK